MSRIGIVIMILLLTFTCQAQYLVGKCSSTNDIDNVLDERLFEGLGWDRYYRALMRASNSIDLEGKTNDVSRLRVHVFNKVLGLHVTTNMPRAAGHLLDKAEWINQIVNDRWPDMGLVFDDVLGMLASATGVCHVATNDLEIARLAAREKDRALGWREGMVWTNWSPMLANHRAWLNEKKCRERWNNGVDKYRYKVVLAAIRRLNVLWKDIEEPKRVKKIRETVESFGLEMPDW